MQDLIQDLLELENQFEVEGDLHFILSKLVDKIAEAMKVDVCSLYLFDDFHENLVLRATHGLNTEAVDIVSMKVGEGLVGKTIEWMKPLSMSTGRRSKSFKYIPETGEERYSSFLSVPLIHNRKAIGVLVVQTTKTKRYSNETVSLLSSLSIPLVKIIEKLKLIQKLEKLSDPHRSQAHEQKLRKQLTHKAIAAAPGISIAKLKIFRKQSKDEKLNQKTEPVHLELEKMRLLESLRWVQEEIFDLKKRAKDKFAMEELSIFDAYSMVLESQSFQDQICEQIDLGMSALDAVEIVISKYIEQLSLADDEYIKERAYDIEDVGRKITDRLMYGADLPQPYQKLEDEAILYSDYWSISDFVDLDIQKTKGILAPGGGSSSHIAILAESLGLPAVFGLASFSDQMREGDTLIIDGSAGLVICNPEKDVLKTYQSEIQFSIKAQRQYLKEAKRKAMPRGGKAISVAANMGLLSQSREALKQGAEEIGLYRTELPFLIRRNMPTEEEQYQIYSNVLKSMKGRAVTIRTLDIGGDKYLPYLKLPKEDNPFLGWRSIRISLDREDLFRIQLRALLRASVHGKLRLLFPMICSYDEIIKVKEIIKDIKSELKASSFQFSKSIPIGMMVEVPSVVEMAASFIKEVHFFSIGSNDLIQYLLAVDRNNSKIANLYDPLHPAVLRSIKKVIDVAHKEKKTVSLCGEMASQTLPLLLLVGFGINQLSMSVPLISKMKSLINRLDIKKLQTLVRRALKMNSSQEIKVLLEDYIKYHDLEDYLY